MGLFPDGTPLPPVPNGACGGSGTGASAGNFSGAVEKTQSCSVKRKIFRSESVSSSSKKNDTSDKKSSGIQLLSTSWEFIRPTIGIQQDANSETDKKDENDSQNADHIQPPRYIEVHRGRISLAPPRDEQAIKDREMLEARIAELEEALLRLQDRVNQSQCGSPTLERDLREQLESMNRALKSKDRRAMQACRDHKTLQARFTKQENSMQVLQYENRTLHQRIRQYEHCLDDVMRKVVDALVAEDSLRDEVIMLKNRVRDLEAQNAALLASPAKGRDEGYCTMSSGQPQPLLNHLEDLPEEPEQWLASAEPCSAEMEDWSMSQEELETALEEDTTDDNTEDNWIFNSTHFLNSACDSQSEEIAALLQDQIVYSDDEDLTCKDFTRDFYRLVNIPESTRSLKSPQEPQLDSSSSDGDHTERLCSPTPSEAGREQITSCSSSDSGEILKSIDENTPTLHNYQHDSNDNDGERIIIDSSSCSGGGSVGGGNIITNNDIECIRRRDSFLEDVLNACNFNNEMLIGKSNVESINSTSWRRSNGWRRVSSHSNRGLHEPETTTTLIPTIQNITAPPTHHNIMLSNINKSPTKPPPVPIRRSYAS